MIVGAGTVTTAENVKAAVNAGAHFGVAPGCNPRVVSLATSLGLPFIPGVCTPSDIEIATSLGCKLLKFFPCEASGGLPFLNAIAAPFRHTAVRFMPSGGVTSENLEAYLASDLVSCVAGTWLATPDDLANGRWEAIRGRCRDVVMAVKRVRASS
jgi:2-dehydro-3-deoxyphosphogluconate aldolase/(4S)-4-hydroxy-2-oxoglutarate aldolase